MSDAKLILILGIILLAFVTMIVALVRQTLHTVRRTREFFASAPVAKETEPAGHPFIESRLVQRLLALLCVGLCAFGTFQLWRDAAQGNGVDLGYAFLFPSFAVLGLGALISPLDFDAQRWKYGRGKPRTWEELPPVMKAAFVAGISAGLVNAMLLAKW